MKNILKKSIRFASVLLLMFMTNSCLENTDLVTENAKSGGLVVPSGLIPYKLGLTPSFNIDVEIPKGVAVNALTVKYYYMRMSDTTMSNVLSYDIAVDGANVSEAVKKALPYTWTKLREGIILPTDPQIPETDLDTTIAKFIGDYWMFSYTAKLADGRIVENVATTQVSIANFFAGTYNVTLLYFHPTAGGTYPTEAYGGVRKLTKDLTPVSPFACTTDFGVWTANKTMINIDASNNVTVTFDRADAVSGDPNDATKVNSYDPETGVIQIYYYYPGAGGNRIFWETFTPK